LTPARSQRAGVFAISPCPRETGAEKENEEGTFVLFYDDYTK
jgi:hypothetical protein